MKRLFLCVCALMCVSMVAFALFRSKSNKASSSESVVAAEGVQWTLLSMDSLSFLGVGLEQTSFSDMQCAIFKTRLERSDLPMSMRVSFSVTDREVECSSLRCRVVCGGVEMESDLSCLSHKRIDGVATLVSGCFEYDLAQLKERLSIDEIIGMMRGMPSNISIYISPVFRDSKGLEFMKVL